MSIQDTWEYSDDLRDSTNEEKKHVCITALLVASMCLTHCIIEDHQHESVWKPDTAGRKGTVRMITWSLAHTHTHSHTHTHTHTHSHTHTHTHKQAVASNQERVDDEETESRWCLFSKKATKFDRRPGLLLVARQRSFVVCTACGHYQWGLRNKAE